LETLLRKQEKGNYLAQGANAMQHHFYQHPQAENASANIRAGSGESDFADNNNRGGTG
jgi:hypothetical protein